MKIGCLKEIKQDENRVGLSPFGTGKLVEEGHEVWIEQGAGEGSNFPDAAYEEAGARIEKKPEKIVQECRLIVKVKEPLPKEYGYFSGNNIIFTYFHFAGNKELTREMMKSKAACVSYETVEENGNLPLLQPMSEVAGRVAVVVGSNFLSKPLGGRGVLVGDEKERVKVLVIGAGHVGMSAAELAVQMDAEVTVLDIDERKVKQINERGIRHLKGIISTPESVEQQAMEADILVGAVLVPGAVAPKVVKKEVVGKMGKGSVIVDVAIDQGGCIETSKPTSHSKPTFEHKGVIHYAVPNMPGAFPQTATLKLTRAILPYVLKIANEDLEGIKADPILKTGLNITDGKIVYQPVADAHKLPYTPL